MTSGELLKHFRQQKGMSQSQLSQRSGVKVATIQRYEQDVRDLRKASADTVLYLSNALGVTVEMLIDEDFGKMY